MSKFSPQYGKATLAPVTDPRLLKAAYRLLEEMRQERNTGAKSTGSLIL